MSFDNHHGIRYLLNKELTEIYATHALQNLAYSMVGIFVPIYLLQVGFQLSHVFLFYVFVYGVETIFFLFGSRVVSIVGIKHSILISMLLTIIFFTGLYLIDALISLLPMWAVIPVLAMVFGTSLFFYWFAFHVDFAQSTSTDTEGEQVGILQAITTLFSVLGPLIGGFIILLSSFQTLFIIVCSIFLFASLPLFLSEEVHTPAHPTMKSFFAPLDRKSRSIYLAEGMRQATTLVIWPVMLYLIAVQVSSMGLLYSVTNLLLAVFSIVVGKLSDTFRRAPLMRAGALAYGVSLTMRSMFTSLIGIFTVQSIGAIFFPLLNVPYSSLVYMKARKHEVSAFIIAWQSLFNMGRVIQMLVALLLVTFYNPAFSALVVALGIGSLCTLAMAFIGE